MLYRHVPGEGRDPVPLSLLPSFTTTASPRGASQHMSALIGFRAAQRLPPFSLLLLLAQGPWELSQP